MFSGCLDGSNPEFSSPAYSLHIATLREKNVTIRRWEKREHIAGRNNRAAFSRPVWSSGDTIENTNQKFDVPKFDDVTLGNEAVT